VHKDDLLMAREVTQADCDALLLNLKLTPAAIKDFKMAWVAQSGMVENISKVVKEFKTARKLTVS
jgi:hypothetical protein